MVDSVGTGMIIICITSLIKLIALIINPLQAFTKAMTIKEFLISNLLYDFHSSGMVIRQRHTTATKCERENEVS